MPKLDTFQIVFGCFFLLPLGLLILGFWLVYLGGAQVATAWQSMNWPSVPGKITKAEIREWTEGGRRMFSDEYQRYAGDVAYSYSVKGTNYENDRIEIGEGGTKGRVDAAQRIEGFHVGQAVTVYFDPADPSDACLRNGARPSAYYFLFGGLFVVAIAGFMVRGWLREYQSIMGGKSTDAEVES